LGRPTIGVQEQQRASDQHQYASDEEEPGVQRPVCSVLHDAKVRHADPTGAVPYNGPSWRQSAEIAANNLLMSVTLAPLKSLARPQLDDR
jgi:hypothetical protein